MNLFKSKQMISHKMNTLHVAMDTTLLPCSSYYWSSSVSMTAVSVHSYDENSINQGRAD